MSFTSSRGCESHKQLSRQTAPSLSTKPGVTQKAIAGSLRKIRSYIGTSGLIRDLQNRGSPLTVFNNPDPKLQSKIQRSMAVQALDVARDDQGQLRVPAYLANTLSKALATNTLSLTITPSDQHFQKAWDFSQLSLSVCRVLIDRWEASCASTRISSSTILTSGWEPSMDDELDIMDQSVELGL